MVEVAGKVADATVVEVDVAVAGEVAGENANPNEVKVEIDNEITVGDTVEVTDDVPDEFKGEVEDADTNDAGNANASKIASEDTYAVAGSDEIMPTATERVLKLGNGWVRSRTKAYVGTVNSKLLSQDTNGSEVKTLFSLWHLLPRRRSVPAYRLLYRLRGINS